MNEARTSGGAVRLLSTSRRERLAAITDVDPTTLGDARALAEALLFDGAADVRAAAATRLAAAPDPGSIFVLLDGAGDEAPSVRQACFAALARLGARK